MEWQAIARHFISCTYLTVAQYYTFSAQNVGFLRISFAFNVDVEFGHASRIFLALVGLSLLTDAQRDARHGGNCSESEQADDHDVV